MPDNEVTIIPADQRRDVTPFELLDRAIASGVPIETLRELMTLQREHQADVARKAFSEAFAKFKAEAIKIKRNRKVNDGPLKGKSYAELISFVQAATPALSKHGLSHSWAITKDEKDWIEITCTLEHSLGGTKTATLGGGPDTGGAKNALQARISTVTYLERATFKAVCGLAEEGDDDDGRGGEVAFITEDQVTALTTLAEEVGANMEKLLTFLKVADLSEIYASRYDDVVKIIKRKGAPKK